MKRTIFVCIGLAAFAAAAGAQQTSQPDPYSGVSTPPPNSTIVDAEPAPPPKPPASHPYPAQTPTRESAPAPQAAATQPQPSSVDPSLNYPPPASNYAATPSGDGTADGIVEVAPSGNEAPSNEPALLARLYASDPDGDIVHPQPLPPGELGEGTVIRVRLLGQLSTATDRKGDAFRSRVASDVLQDGMVLIPAGSEIDGRVVRISSGHLGGTGSMDLRPEAVTLPDGTRYRMYAMVSGAPGSGTRVGAEGTIRPGSRVKRDSIEYGGGVGAGAATGAILGGPVGALAGTLIGASAITVHLLVNHPQATLDSGTALLFTLTEPLNLVPAASQGN
ncbi:MAG: hypothetical protein ACRD27_10675 [Terracidiphilus sp.]